MSTWFGGVFCGFILAGIVLSGAEPTVVEVLPDNYEIVTSTSQQVCSGPTGRETVVHTQTRSQQVVLKNN